MSGLPIMLVDKDGDVFAGPWMPGTIQPVVITGVYIGKDGEPAVLIARLLHEMSNEENAEWVNARVRDARAWFTKQRERAREVGRTWPRTSTPSA